MTFLTPVTRIGSLLKRKRTRRAGITVGQTLQLMLDLISREVEMRYRGSLLGVAWSLLTPLIMLGIYTFVFGVVFRSRWVSSNVDASPMEFAVILFIGLILHQVLAETLNRSPSVIIGNPSYVKKVVFPIHILVPVALGFSLVHAAISLLILLPFLILVFGGIPLTIVYLPLVCAPLCLVTLGIGWFLASLGTYVRDVGQLMPPFTTALLFLAPVFFPATVLPTWLQPWIALNPLTLPVEQARNVLIFGHAPDWPALLVYTGVALVICASGYIWFQSTKKGFADVL